MIHISTDCVFSGKQVNYREDDPFDAEDLYGQSKFGGVQGEESLRLRTSCIGQELRRRLSRMEWFLSQNHGQGAGIHPGDLHRGHHQSSGGVDRESGGEFPRPDRFVSSGQRPHLQG